MDRVGPSLGDQHLGLNIFLWKNVFLEFFLPHQQLNQQIDYGAPSVRSFQPPPPLPLRTFGGEQ